MSTILFNNEKYIHYVCDLAPIKDANAITASNINGVLISLTWTDPADRYLGSNLLGSWENTTVVRKKFTSSFAAKGAKTQEVTIHNLLANSDFQAGTTNWNTLAASQLIPNQDGSVQLKSIAGDSLVQEININPDNGHKYFITAKYSQGRAATVSELNTKTVAFSTAAADETLSEPMVVDLTADFGEGNEPSLEWCKENLAYTNDSAAVLVDLYPTSPTDGEVVVVNTVMDQYATSGFEHQGEAGATYYYKLFPKSNYGRITYSGGELEISTISDYDIITSGEAYNYYNVGDIVTLPMSDYGNIEFEVVGKNVDGNNTITLVTKNILENTVWSNSGLNNYSTSDIRTYLNGTILNKFDSSIQDVIKATSKICHDGTSEITLTDKLWLLSYTEVGYSGSSVAAVEGTHYEYYSSDEKRTKIFNGSATFWWLRTPRNDNTTNAYSVGSQGSDTNIQEVTSSRGLVFGMVIGALSVDALVSQGKTLEEVREIYSDEDILTSETGYSLYSVGDTATLSMDGYGEVLFDVVGKNHDGNNTITLVTKNIIEDNIQWDANNTNDYSTSSIRTYLNNTVLEKFNIAIKDNIISVPKEFYNGNSTVTNKDKLWLLSYTEAGCGEGLSSVETEGSAYSVYNNDASRIKTLNNTANDWWLRTKAKASLAWEINYSGTPISDKFVNSTGCLVFGLVFGVKPLTVDEMVTKGKTLTEVRAVYSDEDILTSNTGWSLYSVGDTATLNMTDYGDVVFDVVGKNHDGENTITLVTKNIIENSVYGNGMVRMDYENSQIDEYLNTTVLSKFDTDIQNAIKGVPKQTYIYSTTSITTINRKLWALSYTEVGLNGDSYAPTEGENYGFWNSDASRVKTLSGNASSWWLRSPNITNKNEVLFVGDNGSDGTIGITMSYGLVFGIVF